MTTSDEGNAQDIMLREEGKQDTKLVIFPDSISVKLGTHVEKEIHKNDTKL